MKSDELWSAIIGSEKGCLLRSALQCVAFFSEEELRAAIHRISLETTMGPLLHPTAYLAGEQFDNARDYTEILTKVLSLRMTLSEIEAKSRKAGKRQ